MEAVLAKRYDVFVSYKREDDAAREILCAALQASGLDPWWDAKLGQGDFRDQLRDEINRCDVVIALWSENAHARPDEVKMEMSHAFGIGKLLPLKLDNAPIPRQFAKENFLPFDHWADEDRAAKQLDHILSEARSLGAHPSRTPPKPIPSAIPVDLGDLPAAPNKLIGRDDEMRLLREAWNDPTTHVVVLHALGGAGKSALLRAFVNERLAAGGDGVARIYGWSAYSQGSGEQKRADADSFLARALADFGYEGSPILDSVEAGRMVAALVQKERVLMLLDGLEPLQDPPGAMKGRFKNKGLAALVKALGSQNPGLLVLTSRQDVPELEGFGDLVVQHPLDQLSEASGADLLVDLGARGRRTELEAAVRDLYGHALSVTLLGTFIAEVCGGDIRERSRFKFGEIILTPEEHDNADRTIRYAKRTEQVIEAYLEQFDRIAEGPDEVGKAERSLLRLLGLFDRPADGAAIDLLLAERIPGLTDDLFTAKTDADGGERGLAGVRELAPNERAAQLREAKSRLRRLRLLSSVDAADPRAIDSHPVIRAYFSSWLEKNAPEAAIMAHEKLYRHYAAAAPDLPADLAQMQPLLLAVQHGGKTRLIQEVLDEVFWRRMCRRERFYIAHVLGAYGAMLTAASSFFLAPWANPHPELGRHDQAFILVIVSHALASLGRLRESVGPREVALAVTIANEQWENAASAGAMLSDVLLVLGDGARAIEVAEQTVESANKSQNKTHQDVSLVTLGKALANAGQIDRAMACFDQADAQGQASTRVGVIRYQRADFMISMGDAETVLLQGRRQLENAQRRSSDESWLLDVGMSWLLVGRAQDALGHAEAATSLDTAIEGLRRADVTQYLTLALLARVTHRRARVAAGELALLESLLEDLAEIEELAEPEMRLFLIDLALERAQLALEVPSAFDDPAKVAAAQIEIAARLIADTGYHRRDRELARLREGFAAHGAPARA